MSFLLPLLVMASVLTSPVTDQGNTLQCWAVAATYRFDALAARSVGFELKLSPKYTVYTKTRAELVAKIRAGSFEEYDGILCETCKPEKIYYEQGAVWADAVEAARLYGVMPDAVYGDFPTEDEALFRELNAVVREFAHGRPRAEANRAVTAVLDKYLGAPPKHFKFQGESYTPKTFAARVLPGLATASGRELVYTPTSSEGSHLEKTWDGHEYEIVDTGDHDKVMKLIARQVRANEPVLVQYKVIDEDRTQAHGRIGFKVHGLRFPKHFDWNDPEILDHYVLAIGAEYDEKGGLSRLLVKNTWGVSSDEGLGFHWMESDYFPLIEGVEVAD